MNDRILEHLSRLVAVDTSDPPKTMNADDPILHYAAEVLAAAGCSVQVTDLGSGLLTLEARRGDPKILLNCHLDTVAADPHWTHDPFSLTRAEDRVHGLGACDIKGAAACMLATIEATDHDVAILFNSDEEAGQGHCIEHFLAHRDWTPEAVVVAEPTDAHAVRRHRGFASFTAVFTGTAGHTSMAKMSGRSAAHDAVRWGQASLELTRPGGLLERARFNIGAIEGGTASNVVNSRTSVRFGFRPRPGDDGEAMLNAIQACVPEGATATWTQRFFAPPLDTDARVEELLERAELATGPDVDFWTEAALFHQAGFPTIVLGPGDIAQAHQADEWVTIDSLDRTADAYGRILRTASLETTHAP